MGGMQLRKFRNCKKSGGPSDRYVRLQGQEGSCKSWGGGGGVIVLGGANENYLKGLDRLRK